MSDSTDILRDPARLAALRRSELLDSAPEAAFDRLTRLASKILHAPVALVSLVDDQRQFFKSQTGLAEPWASQRETPLSHSFCQHVVTSSAPLIVSDARAHPLVHANLAIPDLGVVAYAGIPLTLSDGQTLGSFCAIDSVPREWTAEEIAILTDLAASVMTEIELRMVAQDAQRQLDIAERERNEKGALLDSTRDGIYGTDRDGHCTFINRAGAQLLGYTPQELLGQTMHDLIHHHHADGRPYPRAECPIVVAAQTLASGRKDDEVLWRRDGSAFAAEYAWSPIIAEGQVQGAVITFSDISARKQAARQQAVQYAVSSTLSEAESFEDAAPLLLRAIGEALEWEVGALWRVDEAANVLRCVNLWHSPNIDVRDFETVTLGLRLARGEGLPGRVWQSKQPIWSRDVLSEPHLLRRSALAQVGLRAGAFFPIRSGSRVLGVAEFFSARAQAVDDDLVRTVSTLGNQIGQFFEREQAQTELRQSEALKSAVFATAMDCIVSIDEHGNVLEWNPAAEKTFGYRRDEVLGKEMASLIVPPALRDQHRNGMAHYLATGVGPVLDKRIEITAMRADGSEFPVELAITRSPHESRIQFTGYIRDITERVQVQQALAERVRVAAFSNDVSLALTQSDNLRDMLQRCAQAMVTHLDAAFGRIWTLNAAGQMLELQASAGLYTHLDGPHGRVPVGQFKIGLIAAERQPHLNNDVINDPRVSDPEWARREGMVSFAGYPLIVDENLVGVMAMFARQPLSEVTLQAMAAVANSLALGIERKRIEAEVAKLSLVASQTDNAVIITDRQGCIEWVNDGFTRITGYTQAEVLGQKPGHFLQGPQTDPQTVQCIREALTRKESFTEEILNYHKNGTPYWIALSITPILDTRGEIERFIAIESDISERKAAEEALRHSEERFRSLIEAMPQQVWTARPDGTLDFVNTRALEYFGRTAEAMLEEGWRDVVHPDDLMLTAARWADALESGQLYETEFRVKRKDNTYRWHIVRALPLRDRAGKIAKWFGTNTDITERKEAEEDLQRAKELAVEANHAKSQFLANMSHELRTPLNAVILYSELLQEEAADANAQAFIPDLEKIRAAGKQLLSLVNSVLDLSKIEAGKMELYLETIDVAQLVQEVVGIAAPLVEKQGNRLVVQCADDSGTMHTDQTKLRQSLFNLLSNAGKFTEQGTVTLDVRREATAGAERVVFRVSDSGIGLTAEQIEKLFQPFSQADASTTRRFGGTGLGLAITRHFCAMLGGTIEVESQPNQGATFTIRLPAQLELAPQREDDAEPTRGALEGDSPLVLVVDDDPGVRDLMHRFLTKEGYRVHTLADGAEAVREAREIHPAVITLDVMMPHMDGWQVLSALKADPALNHIPVIMLTIVDNQNLGYTLGASEYLTKPIDRERLTTVLKKYTAAHRDCSVLIVDDDRATRKALRKLLKDQHCTFSEAENGRVALRMLEQHVPDLILLDLLMPEMDGFEFAAALRKSEAWRAIPLVVVTAKDITAEDHLKLDGFVKKVIQKGEPGRDQLLREVRDLIKTVQPPNASARRDSESD